MTEAQPRLYAIVGKNGTGKSTFCKNFINRTLDKGGRVLIITPHDKEWTKEKWIDVSNRKAMTSFTGVRKSIFQKGKTLEGIIANYRKGLLVFDDCRIYFRKMTSDVLEQLFIARRQMNLNQVVVAHGFNAIPPVFFTYINEYILFNTSDNIDKRKNDILNYEQMKAFQREVKIKARKNRYYYKIIKNE